MKNDNLLNSIKNILKDVRFGIFSRRLSVKQFPENTDIVNDFNNMLDSLSDREKMLNENQIITNLKTEQLEYLFNMLNDGAMILSEEFKILAINAIQAKYFKKKKIQLLGKFLPDVLKKYKIFLDNKSAQSDNIKDFFAKDHKNTLFSVEYKGQKAFFIISVKQFVMPNKDINYFILAHNINPEVNLKELQNTFIATLTHDLKVPIVAEKKVLDLLMNNDFRKDEKLYNEALINMQNNNKDMMDLLSTLLDVYKLENGNFDIVKSKTNIYDLISLEMSKLKFLAEENSIKLFLNSENKYLDVMIDDGKIARVIRNILNNALNFAPENSEIVINIKSDDNDNFNISITDFGCGINKDDIPHIFERYFTANKKYRKVGTGLGLYLSKKIVELHGGDILVESIQNKKTTFEIILPVK